MKKLLLFSVLLLFVSSIFAQGIPFLVQTWTVKDDNVTAHSAANLGFQAQCKLEIAPGTYFDLGTPVYFNYPGQTTNAAGTQYFEVDGELLIQMSPLTSWTTATFCQFDFVGDDGATAMIQVAYPGTGASMTIDPVVFGLGGPLTYEVSGTVTLYDGGGLEGVLIDYALVPLPLKSSMSPLPKKVSRNNTRDIGIMTDSNGQYTISDLENGLYTITPSLTDYFFNPISAQVTVSDDNVANVNFTAIAEATGGTGGATVPPATPTTIPVEPVIIGGIIIEPEVVITTPAGSSVDVEVTVAATPTNPGAPNTDLSFEIDLTGNATGLFSFELDFTGLDPAPEHIYWWDGFTWVVPADIVWDYLNEIVSFTITFSGTGPRDGGTEVILGDDDPLPVTLSSFTAIPNVENQNISINWTTQSESNMSGYHVYRSEGSYTQAYVISDLIVAQNNPFTNIYSYTDNEAEVELNYNYWLHSYDMDGTMMTWGPMSAMIDEIPVAALPDATILRGNHPNPFNPTTIISFDVKANEEAQLIIYNMKGQIVERETFLPKVGGYQYTWNADNQASGVYFYKLQSNSYRQIKKMLLIK